MKPPDDRKAAIVPQSAEGTQRRRPRQVAGRRIVKIRITAESSDDAVQAAALVEDLLLALECRMQTPRQGSNPKYTDAQKWMSYGDFVLPAPPRRTRRSR